MAPSSVSTCGGLPSRFRRPRLLIVGCGDVGLRVARRLAGRCRLLAVTSQTARTGELRAHGASPLVADLDDPSSLRRLAGLANWVLHLAPPPGNGATDPRTRHLALALLRRSAPTRLVYGSTTGVYGDCAGQWVDEARPVHPVTARAQRRVDAEDRLRWLARHAGTAVTVLRIPGIYALDRPGGDPRDRLRRGTPVLRAQDDIYTNHIHADDLARACVAALGRGRTQRAINVCDGSVMKVGDYYELIARLSGLPAPERITREQACATLSPMVLSFWSESRRLLTDRMARELRLRLHYPTVETALRGGTAQAEP